MKLTMFTDFGLRALMRVASDPGRAWSTGDLAAEFGISRNHLVKAVGELARAGFLATRRGGGGGVRLARPAEQIRIGEVVRALERGQAMAECFRADGGTCRVRPDCRLRGILESGRAAFLAELDGYTLRDCALPPLAGLMGEATA